MLIFPFTNVGLIAGISNGSAIGDIIASRASISKEEPFAKRASITSILSPLRTTVEVSNPAIEPDDDYAPPTEEEYQKLRKVAGSLPLVAYLLCLVEFAERASYYGAKTVFSNFVQFPLPKGWYHRHDFHCL